MEERSPSATRQSWLRPGWRKELCTKAKDFYKGNPESADFFHSVGRTGVCSSWTPSRPLQKLVNHQKTSAFLLELPPFATHRGVP